jgi:glycosyltransferase involved in cell wall biosynthesis
MTVDIIIPTYQRYDLLQETLHSVAAQTYPHWKCWIAEDGESRETHDVVKPFLQDPRFIYAPGKHAGFPAAPRNRAIRQGDAPYVAFLDDDDLWLPDKLKYQVNFIKDNSRCVLVGCNAFRWSGNGQWNQSSLYFKKVPQEAIPYEKLLQTNHFIQSSVMTRRAALEQAGLFNEMLDPPIGEDYELWLRIGVLGESWVLPEPTVIFRETEMTYYSTLDRRDNYRAAANVYESALQGVDNVSSPLSYPENIHFAAACRRERDFYRAGPRFLGRFRHNLSIKLLNLLKRS